MPTAFKVPIASTHLLWALRVLSKKTYDSHYIRHHVLSYLTPLLTNQLDEAIDIACATTGAHKVYVTRNVTIADLDFYVCIKKRKTVLLLSKGGPWRLRLWVRASYGDIRCSEALQELAANGHVKFQNLVIEAVRSDARLSDTKSKLLAVLQRNMVNVDGRDAIGQI